MKNVVATNQLKLTLYNILGTSHCTLLHACPLCSKIIVITHALIYNYNHHPLHALPAGHLIMPNNIKNVCMIYLMRQNLKT